MAALPKTDPATDPKTAGAPDAEANSAEADTPSKGRGKLLIIAGIVVTVLGIGGGAAFYFLRAAPAEAPAEEAAATSAHKTAIYLNLRPDFIVNSTAVGQRRYLQTNVVLMSRDQAVIEAAKKLEPVIRSALINLLADEDFMVLQTDEGKKALREKMRAAADATLQKEANLTGIEAVLYNSFVMQ
jgi:flagellar protein FliL